MGSFFRKQKETTFLFRVPGKKRLFFKRGYFRITETPKETTVYISGTRKETTFFKEDVLRNGNGNGNEKLFPLSLL